MQQLERMALVNMRAIGCTICLQSTIILDATTDDGSCVYDDKLVVFSHRIKFTGSTGVNMTVFLQHQGAVSTLPITSEFTLCGCYYKFRISSWKFFFSTSRFIRWTTVSCDFWR